MGGEGLWGHILREVRSGGEPDGDGVRLRFGSARAAQGVAPIRTRMLQGLARSGGFAPKASDRGGALSGGRAASGRSEPALNTRQRVIVKAHVAKHAGRGFGGGGGGGALRAHLAYLGREGRSGPERGEFYDRAEESLDAKAQVRDWADDRHHFRFILSPENGDKLEDLRGYVRDTMAEVAADLNEPSLEWIAINHFDTDQPHAHVLVRGARADGRALIIPKEYMARGFRSRAEERATRELGEVSRDQAEERLRREVGADRVTGLDRHLERHKGPDGRVPGDIVSDQGTYGALLRGRLVHLEGLGLAQKQGRDWHLAQGFTRSLEELSREQDVLRTLLARMGRTRAHVEVAREGRVAGQVVEAGADRLVLRDRNGTEQLLPGSADGLRQGELVMAEAGTEGLRVFALGDPGDDRTAQRLTATDRLLDWRCAEREAGRDPPLFDPKTEALIAARGAILLEAGLAMDTDHGVQLTPDARSLLRDADIRLAIAEQLGRKDSFQTEARFEREGHYLGAVHTQSGLFAVAERNAGLVYGAVDSLPQISIGQAVAIDPYKGLIQPLAHGLDHGLELGL